MIFPSVIWDGTEPSFNKLFREVRLSGASLNLKNARCRLDEIVAQGETDPEKFWRYVFTEEPKADPTSEPRFVNWSGKRVDREDALEASRERHRIAVATGFRPKPDRCEVCNRFANIVLDHDHETEKLRGWLCNRCNLILGVVNDDLALLEGLAKYLRENK